MSLADDFYHTSLLWFWYEGYVCFVKGLFFALVWNSLMYNTGIILILTIRKNWPVQPSGSYVFVVLLWFGWVVSDYLCNFFQGSKSTQVFYS